MRFCVIILFAAILLIPAAGNAMGSKNVPEQLDAGEYVPNSPSNIGRTYYVAQNDPKASDDNPGTKDRPFKTIAKAASLAKMFDKVIIDEGVYREQVRLVNNGHMYIPESKIIYMAKPGARVYLKASDVFDPQWHRIGSGVFKAKLPKSLFKHGDYNPYELSCVIDDRKKVRPINRSILPETLGQIYVAGKAFEQLTSIEAVKKTAGSFVVSADGKEIIVHFAQRKLPTGKLVELTVRRRCFEPAFTGDKAFVEEFGNVVFIETRDMFVGHAAEPGPFSYARSLTIRKNGETGIIVRKTLCLTQPDGLSVKRPSYISKEGKTLISSVSYKQESSAILSDDAGKTWEPISVDSPSSSYYLDEEKDRLIKFPGGDGSRNYVVSADKGKTWTAPQEFNSGGWHFNPVKLPDGRLFVPRTMKDDDYDFWHQKFSPLIGTWREDLSGIDWQELGEVKISPKNSFVGLDEPHSCLLPDGRIFTIFRHGAVLTTQDSAGAPSVKLYMVSDDNGKSWSEPAPLIYDDGCYIYSGRSFPDVIRSSKNGRYYVIMNISKPTFGCDPRTVLNIAELDPQTLRIKKNTLAIIEAKHPEQYHLVRFSNFVRIEDRETKNLTLFMGLAMSEYCFVRRGYDYNYYRYEIEFPD